MIEFKKENGFPRTIRIETEDFVDDTFEGYKSKIYNSRGKLIREFTHKDLRARVHWADGYFSAFKKRE